MDFEKVVEGFGTILALKRFAGAHVVDHTRLSEEELIAALKKTAPQYWHRPNVEQALRGCLLSSDRDIRTISPVLLGEVLLNCDQFTSAEKETDEAVIGWEKSIVDSSNEPPVKKTSSRARDLELFEFVLSVAWEHNDAISVDEKNLIEKIKAKLGVTDREYRVMEAKLGKFPAPNNATHTRDEIDRVRKHLQSLGLLSSVRDGTKVDYDVIPVEIAAEVRKLLGSEIRRYGYEQMLGAKYVKKKEWLRASLEKCGFNIDGSPSSDELRDAILERVPPSVLIGGVSPKDGLSIDNLKKWCGDLSLGTSGAKAELIGRIIDFYDNLTARVEVEGDERALWYEHYAPFAARDRDFLRSQQLIDKDLEMESRFEDATDYLFEVKLGHKPLKLVGSEHADGMLSYRDGLILWDNKSKESAVSLSSHIKQFTRYVDRAEKRVEGFIVIGPSFTDDSAAEAMGFLVEKRTPISLITATELKSLAEEWSAKDEGAFDLGYLIAPGRFDRSLVRI